MKLTVTFKSQSSLTSEKISFPRIIYSRDWESFIRPLASRMTNDLSSHAWCFRITLSCLQWTWTRVCAFSQNFEKRAFHITTRHAFEHWRSQHTSSVRERKLRTFSMRQSDLLSRQHKLFPFSIPLLSVAT